jgi:cellulose synthase/poly-beta-1,6-N-acetylglucosamine synthase-like glycosyltransferase
MCLLPSMLARTLLLACLMLVASILPMLASILACFDHWMLVASPLRCSLGSLLACMMMLDQLFAQIFGRLMDNEMFQASTLARMLFLVSMQLARVLGCLAAWSFGQSDIPLLRCTCLTMFV